MTATKNDQYYWTRKKLEADPQSERILQERLASTDERTRETAYAYAMGVAKEEAYQYRAIALRLLAELDRIESEK